MKRVLSLLLTIALCLSLAACGKKESTPQDTAPISAATTAPTTAPTSESTAATDVTDESTAATEATEAATAATNASTVKPTAAPTTKSTVKPTTAPTTKPTTAPTSKPTEKPTVAPTTKPTEKPTEPPHTHTWKDATCQAPKTCTGCGATEGSVGTHIFENGVCTVCKAADILNPDTNLKICGDTTEEYISQAYLPYNVDTISARGISFYNDGGYGEGVYCLLLDAMFSSNEEEVDKTRTPVTYNGKKYYRIGSGMSPAEVDLTETEILITKNDGSTIKMILMGEGNLKVTASADSNYPVGMVLSTSWSYLK